MKKIFKSVLALFCVLAMVLAFAGCGEKEKQPDDRPSVSNSAEDRSTVKDAEKEDGPELPEASEESEEPEKPAKKYATVEDFANSEEAQEAIENLNKTLAATHMQLKLTGTENKLIYTYTFDLEMDTDGLSERLQKELDRQKATFTNVAKSLLTTTDAENPAVVIRYLDRNGKEICSVEFPASEEE